LSLSSSDCLSFSFDTHTRRYFGIVVNTYRERYVKRDFWNFGKTLEADIKVLKDKGRVRIQRGGRILRWNCGSEIIIIIII